MIALAEKVWNAAWNFVLIVLTFANYAPLFAAAIQGLRMT
jgi:hypothetical protein